jgi:rRNA-processing protein FCF1
MMLFEFSLDLKGELSRLLGSYTIVIPEAVVHELHMLKDQVSGGKQLKAKAALKFIKPLQPLFIIFFTRFISECHSHQPI